MEPPTDPSPSVPCHPLGTPLQSMIPATSVGGTPPAGASAPLHISVMSMNLLAPCYVRSIDKRTGAIQPYATFEWVKDASFLDWSSRKPKILAILQSCQADVICVQELQVERNAESSQLELPDWLDDLVTQNGYEVFLPPQAELDALAGRNVRVLDVDAAVTCAVFVQQSQWKAVRGLPEGDGTTSVSVCLTNAHNTNVDPIVVTSVHLDATQEKKRVSQLTKCLGRARILLDCVVSGDAQTNPQKKSLTCIMAGDMNAEFMPGSCVEAFLVDQQDDRDQSLLKKECAAALRLTSAEEPSCDAVKHWKRLRNETIEATKDACASIQRIPTGPTRSALEHLDHQEESANRAMMQWKLDHVLYSKDRLKPVGRWSTLEADPTACKMGLPTKDVPSDHMPIAAVFEVKESTRLDDVAKAALLNALESMTKAHSVEMKALGSEMDKREQEVEDELRKKSPATEMNFSKKKKQKGPPPAELMEVKRERRTRMRALRDEHKESKLALVKSLDDQGRLIVHETYNMPATRWANKSS